MQWKHCTIECLNKHWKFAACNASWWPHLLERTIGKKLMAYSFSCIEQNLRCRLVFLLVNRMLEGRMYSKSWVQTTHSNCPCLPSFHSGSKCPFLLPTSGLWIHLDRIIKRYPLGMRDIGMLDCIWVVFSKKREQPAFSNGNFHHELSSYVILILKEQKILCSISIKTPL